MLGERALCNPTEFQKNGCENRMTDALFIRSYEQFRKNVYAAAYSLVRNAADAADLQQETFMRLFTCDKEFESDTHIKAWLLRVAVNLSKNHLRDHSRITLTELTDTMPAPEDPMQQDVLTAVLELPEKYRIPIHLFYYEDYSVKEIAEILELTEGTVKTRLRRGRSLLEKALGKVA